jgi:hypothetical protein
MDPNMALKLVLFFDLYQRTCPPAKGKMEKKTSINQMKQVIMYVTLANSQLQVSAHGIYSSFE